MRKRLLRRQIELVEYLTSDAAIFGDEFGAVRPPPGFDPPLLRVEAWLSYEKRVAKIRAVFAKTFALLGAGPAADFVRQFAEAFPPRSIGRLDNARQFHRFLTGRWQAHPPDPPYLADVAAVELACAEAVAVAAKGQTAPSQQTDIRRAPGAILTRCAHDVRPIFEPEWDHADPVRRDTPLAVIVPAGGEHPQIFELLPSVFALLAALDDFTDPAAFGAASEIADVIDELAALGLVEKRRCE